MIPAGVVACGEGVVPYGTCTSDGYECVLGDLCHTRLKCVRADQVAAMGCAP